MSLLFSRFAAVCLFAGSFDLLVNLWTVNRLSAH
jgi:hypothetical protein